MKAPGFQQALNLNRDILVSSLCFHILNSYRYTLEIMPEKKDKDGVPVYDFTFEDVGKYRDSPVLPFNAFGTLAMVRGCTAVEFS